jgi:hypothetical protein
MSSNSSRSPHYSPTGPADFRDESPNDEEMLTDDDLRNLFRNMHNDLGDDNKHKLIRHRKLYAIYDELHWFNDAYDKIEYMDNNGDVVEKTFVKNDNIKIDVNSTGYDPIEGAVKIKRFLNENPNHIAVKINNDIILVDLESVLNDDIIFYECYKAETLREENINKLSGEVLYNLRKIGGDGYGYLWQILAVYQNPDRKKYYAFQESKRVNSVVSEGVMSGENMVSASHCQEGQGGIVYDMVEIGHFDSAAEKKKKIAQETKKILQAMAKAKTRREKRKRTKSRVSRKRPLSTQSLHPASAKRRRTQKNSA